MTPLVSVVIPAYGHADFIAAAVASARAQSTDVALEVVVVNDGSPDRTAEVLAPFVAAQAIRYVEQPNAGQATARNRGLVMARGRFIAFLDDDDVWPHGKLAWQVRELTRHDDVMAVAGGARIIDCGGTVIGSSPVSTGEVRFESLFSGNPFRSPGQLLFRADALRQIGGFRTDIWGCDDLELLMRLARVGHIMAIDRDALLYRMHGGNASNDVGRMFEETMKVLRLHLPAVPGGARGRVARVAYHWAYWYMGRTLLGQFKRSLSHADGESSARYGRRLLRLLPAAARDPVLAKQLLADLLPRRWRPAAA